MKLPRHSIGLQQILREGVQPALQVFRVRAHDMRRNDFPLLQVNLFKLIGLINGGREKRILHQQQMIVGLDLRNGIDDVFQTREIFLLRSHTDPVPFSPLGIRCKVRHDVGLLVEDSASVQNGSRHQPT